MPRFDPAAYGPTFAPLLGDRLPELGPGRPEPAVRAALDALTIDSAFAGRAVVDSDLAAGCLSACWLRWDYLAESHTLSQRIETAEGSYWHGIIHRREPDFPNAKYWFARVGRHRGVMDPLGIAAAELAQAAGVGPEWLAAGRWNAVGFIDLCEEALGTDSEVERLCRRIAEREFELLFDWCWRGAVGG